MNGYDIKYNKHYSALSKITNKMIDVSAEEKLASLINSDWKHSWHWPKDIDEKWLDRVSDSLETEMKLAKDRIKDLKLAQEILDKISDEAE